MTPATWSDKLLYVMFLQTVQALSKEYAAVLGE